MLTKLLIRKVSGRRSKLYSSEIDLTPKLLPKNSYLFQIYQCILIQPCIFELQIVKWTSNFI